MDSWEELSDEDIKFSIDTELSEESDSQYENFEQQCTWLKEKESLAKVESDDTNNYDEEPIVFLDTCDIDEIPKLDTNVPIYDYDDFAVSYKQIHESNLKTTKILELCESIPMFLYRPHMLNLKNQFSKSELFLVDGDSLLISALNDENLNWNFGGEMLHLTYLIERKMQMFVRSGGKYRVIFFRDNNVLLWNDTSSTCLAREMLILHLRFNMSITVIEDFQNVWDGKFATYIKEHKPTFMLMGDEGINHCVKADQMISQDSRTISHHLFQWQIHQVLNLHLDVAFLEGIQVGVSTLNSFFFPSSNQCCQAYEENIRDIHRGYEKLLNSKQRKTKKDLAVWSDDFPGLELESNCIIQMLHKYRNDRKFNVILDFVKVFLVYSLLKKELPLRQRSFPLILTSSGIEDFISKIQSCLLDVLTISRQSYINCTNQCLISDIWDGNLFATVCMGLCENLGQDLSTLLDQDNLASYTETLRKIDLHCNLPGDLEPNISGDSQFKVLIGKLKVKTFVIKDALQLPEIIPIESELLQRYVGDVYESITKLPKGSARIDELVPKLKKFEDKYHWHCKRLLLDEMFFAKKRERDEKQNEISSDDDDGLSDYQRERKNRSIKKKQQRYKYQLPRFRKVYGDSMVSGTGDQLLNIVVDTTLTTGKKKNRNKSKRVEQMIEDIKEKKLKEARDKDIENWIRIQDEIKEMHRKEVKQFHRRALEVLENVKISSVDVKKEINFKKISLYKEHYDLIKEKKNEEGVLVQIFLLVREMTMSMEGILTDKDKDKIAEILTSLKFEKLSQLLHSINKEDNHLNNRCHLEFQIKFMSHLLLRDDREDPDERVGKTYIPDTWQRILLDSIDMNHSALIVAPTSSGKTFASYYCMEKILRKNNDDVVVYVSPTKALCNQVTAMIYNRYGNKKMPAGKTVCGVFTRDFQENVDNCQILVTVPQCLEILLLSIAGFMWTQKIKYVIFDEIHCIGDTEQGAEVWEHVLLLISCPFLALSATVENPHEMHDWLKKMQQFQKENRDRLFQPRRDDSYIVDLVIVADRHSDLEKYTYLPKQSQVKKELLDTESIQQLHPCCALNFPVVREHGIPDHISMSPRESFDLFNAMKEVWPDNNTMTFFKPCIYFNDDITFLKRSDVKEYEKSLLREFSNWAKLPDGDKKFKLVLHSLNPKFVDPKGDTIKLSIPRNFLKDSFVTLLETLKEKNMLPVIVFCLDRRNCEMLVNQIVQYCQEQEHTYRKKHKADNISDFEKRMAKKKRDKESDPLENNLCRNNDIIWLEEQLSGVTFRGIGVLVAEDLSYLYNRVSTKPSRIFDSKPKKRDDVFMKGIKYGISYHHSGLNNKDRSTVEILFRRKFLNVVVATSTLALGIHVPCKTVVLAGNSTFLTPLMYRQMSGRAGRRGFDMIGHVIFDGLSEKKISRLMSGSLPSLLGNFPMSVSLSLRLLILVKEVIKNGKSSQEEAKDDTLTRVLSLLKHPLILKRHPEFDSQFKHYFLFSTQFLLREGLIDGDGVPQGLAGVAAHLHYHEPRNYAFISCLNSGLFHRLCKTKNAKNKEGQFREVFLRELVSILSHFFTDKLVHHSHMESCKLNNSIVTLPPLPKAFEKSIMEYNKRVNDIFDMYLLSVATYCAEHLGEDNTLPLSGVKFKSINDYESKKCGTLESFLIQHHQKNRICSSFAGLSSRMDVNLYEADKLVTNIRHQVFTDVKVIPTMPLHEDLNSYALDYFKHGIEDAILRENYLQSGEAYQKIKDFALTIKTIAVSFELYAPENDIVVSAFNQLASEYDKRFKNGSW